MHRSLTALIAFAALPALLAVAPASDAPVVVVFPLQAPASLNRDTMGRIVTVLGDTIAQDGHVRVIPSDPDTQRADFLSTARKDSAQFYVTGYLTPLGDGATMMEQLVSVQTGLIVYSNSSQVTSLKDIRAQGDILRTVIVDRVSRTWNLDTSPAAAQPAATAAPRAVTAGAPAPSPEANVGALFHHKKAKAPAAAPSPSSAVAPEATATP